MSEPQLRTSRTGLILYRDEGVIWDDFLQHRQLGLPPGSEYVLRHFRHWEPSDGQPADLDPALIELLRGGDVLIERGSPQHRLEAAILDAWQPWSPLTTAYHLSSAFQADEKFLTQEQSDQQLREKVESDPPPSVHFTHPRALDRIQLSGTTTMAPPATDLWTLLSERRSIREFGSRCIDLSQLTTALQLAVPSWFSSRSQTALKQIPSGGGRHPTELYLYARDVDGLEPGVYHLSTATFSLELLSGAIDETSLLSVCGEQIWTSDAQALLFYTSRVWMPPWGMEKITEDGREQLRAIGFNL